ncbi:MAG TPA: serine/threonine-protein kinase [Dehalococcoidia bacterium]|nr:serine/threonine-protein kinase [Dehalococcoidia bacterium]
MAEDAVAAGLGRGGVIAPGTVIGPYRVERQIGRGGMSTVYAATHIALDRVIALKVLLPSLSGDGDFVERFLAEARSAARLDYPHIVPVYDSGEIEGLNYIAMKLLDGRDLRAILQERRSAGQDGLPLDRAISITSQAAGALEYAHQHRVVHRDVKPANIYVDDNDRVTLVDFGIARALDRASSTLTGTVIGTPAYMSPEQARGLPADFRSDIYSLGVVLYEALVGRPPFTGEPHAVMHAHANATPAVLATVPHGVNDVVQRALAKNPEDRYQSAGALAFALSNAAGGQLARQALATPDGEATDVFPDAVTPTVVGPQAGPAAASTSANITNASTQTVAGTGAREAAAPAPTAARQRLPAAAATGLALVLIIAAALAWAVLLGPLASKDGRLAVSSDPPGATVTVDGNKLGVTPLGAHSLAAGSHEVVVDKPGYVQVKRTERLQARATDNVNTTLTPLPAGDLLTVQQAIVAKDVGAGPNNTITVGTPVTSVRVNEEFGMVVTVAPKPIAQQDVSFRQEIALLDPAGNRLTGSAPVNATIAKSDAAGKAFAFTFHFNPNSDGTIPTGTYQLQFLVDGHAVVTQPITLVS